MNNVLIVEDSANLLKSIKQSLAGYASKFNILVSTNGEEAIDSLKANDISVLVTDLYMPKVDGLELLSYVSRHYLDIPCIVMTAFASPEIMEYIGNLGIYRFLEKPFKTENLANAIIDAIGAVENSRETKHLSTAAFLLLIQEDQRTCTLEVISNQGLHGYFYFIDGRLYDARYGKLSAEEAAEEILTWEKVSFNLQGLEEDDVQANIHLGLNALLKKVNDGKAKGVDSGEKPESGEDITDSADLIFPAIRDAESGKGNQANLKLVNVLRNTPKNSKAWLWFARTTTNFKKANTGLRNAATISPNDAEIVKELDKYRSAVKSGCEDTSNIEHCHFCWAPLLRNSLVCHYCNAHQDVHEDFFHSTFFSSASEPNAEIMAESFQRFTKATILEPDNIRAHFLLAMTHINLNQWDEALEELQKAEEIDPEKFQYQAQLALLKNFTEHLGDFVPGEKDEAENSQSVPAPVKGQPLIMVVEDSKTTRTIISKMLKTGGYEVVEANDGIDALVKCKEKMPDLILLDIIMPGMDGYQTLTTLKKIPGFSRIPVIMLTAKDSLVDKLRGKMSGSSEYLTKPFRSLDLLSKIRKHLG